MLLKVFFIESLTVDESVGKVHSRAEAVNQDLGHFGRVEVRLPAEGVVDQKSGRLRRIPAGEQEHLDVLRIGADENPASVKGFLKENDRTHDLDQGL
jgi:hypothetical protein